jgi:hypothetical protein
MAFNMASTNATMTAVITPFIVTPGNNQAAK